jgi:hypothetical protein
MTWVWTNEWTNEGDVTPLGARALNTGGPAMQGLPEWARRVSNLRPLACEASALPLSYAPSVKRRW